MKKILCVLFLFLYPFSACVACDYESLESRSAQTQRSRPIASFAPTKTESAEGGVLDVFKSSNRTLVVVRKDFGETGYRSMVLAIAADSTISLSEELVGYAYPLHQAKKRVIVLSKNYRVQYFCGAERANHLPPPSPHPATFQSLEILNSFLSEPPLQPHLAAYKAHINTLRNALLSRSSEPRTGKQ